MRKTFMRMKILKAVLMKAENIPIYCLLVRLRILNEMLHVLNVSRQYLLAQLLLDKRSF